jgi:hypothetical protein
LAPPDKGKGTPVSDSEMESLRTMAESQGDVAWAVTEIERLRAENERLRAENERLRRLFLLVLKDEYGVGDRLIAPVFAPLEDYEYIQGLWDAEGGTA